MAAPIIQVDSLVFDYPTLRALHGVSFEIEAGSITALVGPNGAGKTTLLRCLASLETPIAGRVEVDGLEVEEHPREVHRRLGYLSDFFGLYDELTVARCLAHRAGAQGVPSERRAALVEQAAARTGLSDRLRQKAGELSRGLRQRLAIAQAILHEPKILLLDEPASGLDPAARQELSRLLLTLRDQGMTQIVSSHILAELEDYSSHLMILREGRLMEHRALAGPGEATGRITVAIELAQANAALGDFLAALPEAQVIEAGPGSAKLELPADPMARHGVLARLLAEGFMVAAFQVVRPDLQEAYLSHLREQGEGRP
ncbi:MAG: ABC transporter ATP-binding protein [Pseudomonadota bacterium]